MDIRSDGDLAGMVMERALMRDEQAVISRASGIPIHTQFRAHLLRRIERGDLRQGQKLPSEREYADQLGVSLAPIRQAILDLVKEGYLNRTRGRGTFVHEAKVDEKIAILSSFTQSLRAKGHNPDIRIRFRGLVTADAVIGEALRTRERKLLLIFGMGCLMIIGIILISLWHYRELIGFLIVGLAILSVLVMLAIPNCDFSSMGAWPSEVPATPVQMPRPA